MQTNIKPVSIVRACQNMSKSNWTEVAPTKQNTKSKQFTKRQSYPNTVRDPPDFKDVPRIINVPSSSKILTVDDALKMVFPNYWSVWIHKNSSGDWSINGYNKIMTINNVGELWSFINTYKKLNYMDYQFFVMRGDIVPIWEYPENKDGGAVVIRLRVSDKNLLNVWEDICLFTVNEQICSNPSDINGISFNLKNDLTVIKIWNKNGNDDISKKISRTLISKYQIRSMVYIKNRPEY